MINKYTTFQRFDASKISLKKKAISKDQKITETSKQPPRL